MIERRREPKPVTVEKILPEDREESDAEEKTAEISGQINTGEIPSDHKKEDLYKDEIKKRNLFPSWILRESCSAKTPWMR